MIENLVVAWLTDASERSYELAFSQLLLIEGHHVLQGPLHHAYEHGKDIIARGPEGTLDVYQLKSGSSKLDTRAVESVHRQLSAAAESTVTHPSLERSQLPDRVFLVTNQSATAPAQNRIRVLSDGNTSRGLPPLILIAQDTLVSKFVRAQDRFFPSDPASLERILSLFVADGHGPLPIADFFAFLEAITPVFGKRPSAREAGRMISAAALTTAFALRAWARADNHHEVAAGWTCYCVQLLRVVERYQLGEDHWKRSYRLALAEIRRRAGSLLEEASDRSDLVLGHPADVIAYPARVVCVCGLISASVLSERIEGEEAPESVEQVSELIERELPYAKIMGESQAPAWFMMSLVLALAGRVRRSTELMMSWIHSIASANAPHSKGGIPDPYHGIEEILVSRLKEDHFDGEQFSGISYTLHVAVRWMARRLWRQNLASIWASISRVQLSEFEPSHPIQYFDYRTQRGTLHSWFFDQPTSWQMLRESSLKRDTGRLPKSLLKTPEFLPFFSLFLPHRFTAPVADSLDHAVTGLCNE